MQLTEEGFASKTPSFWMQTPSKPYTPTKDPSKGGVQNACNVSNISETPSQPNPTQALCERRTKAMFHTNPDFRRQPVASGSWLLAGACQRCVGCGQEPEAGNALKRSSCLSDSLLMLEWVESDQGQGY